MELLVATDSELIRSKLLAENAKRRFGHAISIDFRLRMLNGRPFKAFRDIFSLTSRIFMAPHLSAQFSTPKPNDGELERWLDSGAAPALAAGEDQ